MNKNQILFIIAILSCFLLTGCEYVRKGDWTAGGSKDGQEAKADDTITIGLSQIGSESDWRMASTESVKASFSSAYGYDLRFDDAQQKQENQLKAIRDFIDQGVDYIIIDPIVETGWDSVLLEAREAGIPVIIYDRRVEVEDDSLYTCWIGSDFYLEGMRACEWLSDFLDRRGIDAEINIVNIQGSLGASAQIGRTKALDDSIRARGKWKLLSRSSGDYTTAKGKEVVAEMLDIYGDKINVVYAENDNMAYGAIDAIENKGYKVGTELDKGEIMVMSFDASHNGLQMTLDGDIAVNTECNPLYGPRLVEIIETLEKGGSVKKETFIDEEQFSAAGYIGTVQVEGRTYDVTYLTSKVIEERPY